MGDTVKDRIGEYARYKNLSISKFEQKAGLSNGYVFGMRRGLGAEKLQQVLRAFPDLSRDWLLYGEGTMLTTTPNMQAVGTKRQLPLIPIDALAGIPTEDNYGIKLQDCEKYTIPEFIDNGAQFLIKVSGDSMQPKYYNGDIVACRRVQEITFFQWGKIYLLDTEQGPLIKQVYEDKTNPNNVICHSLNTTYYPDFSLPKKDIRTLSTIVGCIHME